MQRPISLFAPLEFMPPMHEWPRPIKRIILAIATALVIGSYLMLAGGIIIAIVVLLGQIQ